MRKYRKRTQVCFKIVKTSVNFEIKAIQIQSLNESNAKIHSLNEENRLIREKYIALKGKYRQIEGKFKSAQTEKERLADEKSQLQEKNHSYIQDATRLHQLTEEMKEFENKVYGKKITQLEKQVADLERDSQELRHENQDLRQRQQKGRVLEERNDDFKENRRIETKIEKLIRENNRLVVSMQNALDTCSNVRIIDINEGMDTPNKDIKELLNKIERLMSENELARTQERAKDAVIVDLRDKLERLERLERKESGRQVETEGERDSWIRNQGTTYHIF